jgi:hypothetical protein
MGATIGTGVARDALALRSLQGSRLTSMTEETALVAGSTGNTPERVGRVSIIENQPKHEAGSGTARDRDRRDKH